MRKTLVEECRAIRAAEIREALGNDAEGLFAVQIGEGETVQMQVGGTSHRTAAFVCPGCGRYAYTLYQTPIDERWRCERCHDLQYQIHRNQRGVMDRNSHSGRFVADVRPERKKNRRN